MTDLITGHSGAIARWVAGQIPHVDEFGPCEAIGVANGDHFYAGVVYHDYQEPYGTIQLSMAAANPRWAKKDVIGQLLKYPFEQLGCYRVWTLTPVSNIMALKVNVHIGFKREAICNSAFGKNKHGVVMRLLKPDYEKRYGQKTA